MNGGIAEEFFRRVAEHYDRPFEYLPDGKCDPGGPEDIPFVFEPHVAENILVDMLRRANVSIWSHTRVVDVILRSDPPSEGKDPSIDHVLTADGRVLRGAAFIDGTYEGALMKMANVSYTFGREANTTYHESCGGRLPHDAVGWPFGDTHQFPGEGVSPYTDETNTTLIKGVHGGPVAPVGA